MGDATLPHGATENTTMPVRKRRLRWLAFLLSLFWPGVGQIYATQIKRGGFIFGVLLVTYIGVRVFFGFVPPTSPLVFLAFVIISLGLIAFYIWAAIDAVVQSRRPSTAGLTRYNRLWVYVGLILVALIVSAASGQIRSTWRTFSTPSASMAPTLEVGDFIAVWTNYQLDHPVRRGDVVVFKKPTNTNVDYVKRVVGLPGDRVQLIKGDLYLNGEITDRQPKGDYVSKDVPVSTMHFSEFLETLPGGPSYLILRLQNSDESPANNTKEFIIPAGHYFVLGDNRDNSADSRFLGDIGYVPAELLVGRVELVYFSKQHWTRSLTQVQ